MKLRSSLALGFLTVTSLFFIISSSRQKQLVSPPKFVKPPGSMRTLNTWSAARDYPFAEGPENRYFDAWEQVRQLDQAPAQAKMDDGWQPIGPINLGGRTLAIEMDPVNPNLIYAGSASGGLWRSESGGQGENAWTRVATGFPILGVSSIAINPQNPQEIYVGTGEVYGYNPTAPGIGTRLTRGSYGMGIIKSDDGGKSWQLSLDWRYHQKRGIQDLAFTPLGNQIWAATTEGVYVSEDGGQSWDLSLEVPMATSLSIDPTQPSHILVGCGGFGSAGQGIYQTTDSGQSWARDQRDILGIFLGKIILHRAPSDPNIVYASVGHRNDAFGLTNQQAITWLLRSNDGGANWAIRNTTDYAAYQGWYSHFVAVHPEDPNHLVVAGVTLLRSDNGGLHLYSPDYTVGGDGSMVDFHAGVYQAGTNKLYIACDQGIFAKEDNSSNYEPHMHGYQTTQFYRGTAQAPDRKDLIAGTPQDRLGTFYRGGPDWESTFQGHEGGHTIFKPDNSDIFLIGSAHMSGLQRFGMDETPVQDLPIQLSNPLEDIFVNTNFNAPMTLAPSNDRVVYSGRSLLYRSTTFGTQWDARNNGEELDGNPIGHIAVSYQDFNSLYVATSPRQGPAHVYRSRDGGQTLTDITAGLPDRWPSSLAIDPRRENTAYITFSGFGSSHLFKTTDGGETWQDLDGGKLPDLPVNGVFLDPDYPDHLYLMLDFGVLASLDGGATWVQWAEGLPEAVMAVDMVTYRPDRTARLVTHGNGIFERKLLEPSAQARQETRLIYPWISRNEGLFESTLIANNLSALPIEVSLTARRTDGTQETVTREIPPGGLLAEPASTLFPNMGSGTGFSVVLQAPVKEVYGRWVTASLLAASGGSPSQGVAIPIAADAGTDQELRGDALIFSYLPTTPDFISASVLVNTGDQPTDITLRFFDRSGVETAQTILNDVPPLVPMAALASQFLPDTQSEAMMTATSSGAPLTGVSFVFNQVFKETAIGNATVIQSTNQDSSELYFPWISQAAGEYRSTLVLNNLGDQDALVTLTARRENGDEETINLTLPAKGFIAEESDVLFTQLGSGAGYCVQAQVNSDQVYGQWVSKNLRSASGSSPSLGVAIRKTSAIQNSKRFGNTLLLGYLPTNEAMIAAPVLVNLGDQPTSIALDFIGPDGQILFRDRTTLDDVRSLRPFARTVGDLLPNGPGEIYILARSESEAITGVAFVFNQGFFEPAIGNAQAID